MKKILAILCVILITFSACQQRTYQAEPFYNDQGQQVMYVQQPNGNYFYMDYLLYMTLMRQGGYNTINNYYVTHQSDFSTTSQSRYSTYYPKVNGKLNKEYYTQRKNYSSYTSPSRVTTSSSYSSPSRKTYKNSSSYSSPSKNSYSSPSRSYSSPSRSYSSPSRSYSSPSRSSSSSRSYSSPGRH